MEDPAEPERRGQRLERAGRIGDGDEPAPGGGFAEDPDGPLVEEGEERDQFGGRARFRGNEEERPAKVEPGRRIGHGAGFGRVEDLELEAACRRGERAGEDLGGQARAAHAQDDGPDEALAADGGREGLHVRDAGLGRSGGVQPAKAVGKSPGRRSSRPTGPAPRCGGRRRPRRGRGGSPRARPPGAPD